MKKLVLWLGIILLAGGGILVFVSGTQNASMQPVYPTLNKFEGTSTIFAVVGLVLTIIGVIWSLTSRRKA